MNIEFQYPLNLVYIVVPILTFLALFIGGKRKVLILKSFSIKDRPHGRRLQRILITLGLILVVFAVMGPQKEIGEVEVKGEGLDIFVLLDTSKSMLSQDIMPSRMARAKKITKEIINQLDGDRIGFIPFSSSAYVQMPLTIDYDLADMFLEVVDTDMISGGGSDVGQAIKLATQSFKEAATGDQVIIILSDGEEHDNETEKVLKSLAGENLKIYTVGIGTTEGGLIPEYNKDGTKILGYKRDENGKTVMTKLNENLLRSLAKETEGKYYKSALDIDEVNSLMHQISKLKRGTLDKKMVKQYEQLYQYFLGMGLVLIVGALELAKRSKV